MAVNLPSILLCGLFLASFPMEAVQAQRAKRVAAAIAKPASNPGTWFNALDYPSRALRNEQQGRVQFRLDVAPTGAVTRCTVTSSSGSGDLDDGTCALMMRKARFSPMKRAGTYSSAVVWRLPEAPVAGEQMAASTNVAPRTQYAPLRPAYVPRREPTYVPQPEPFRGLPEPEPEPEYSRPPPTNSMTALTNMINQQAMDLYRRKMGGGYAPPPVQSYSPPASSYQSAPRYQAAPKSPSMSYSPAYGAASAGQGANECVSTDRQNGLVNRCSFTISVAWCVVGVDCAGHYVNMWNIGPGNSYPYNGRQSGGSVNYGACRGRDTISPSQTGYSSYCRPER